MTFWHHWKRKILVPINIYFLIPDNYVYFGLLAPKYNYLRIYYLSSFIKWKERFKSIGTKIGTDNSVGAGKSVCNHILVPLSVHKWDHTYMHTYIHTYIRTYIHTCIHKYIHTPDTYINTWVSELRPSRSWIAMVFQKFSMVFQWQ